MKRFGVGSNPLCLPAATIDVSTWSAKRKMQFRLAEREKQPRKKALLSSSNVLRVLNRARVAEVVSRGREKQVNDHDWNWTQ